MFSGVPKPHAAFAAPAGVEPTLPLSKLRGVPFQARVALKIRRITTCGQLLTAAAHAQDRAALAHSSKIAPEVLTNLVQRADMTRVNGIGAMFGLILEELGIRDVGALAEQEPEALHDQMRQYNRQERIARRSPTPEEATSWVEQARSLPKLVTY
jgi:predicted flap endonuclease-1-like 5' DNA nuclease